MDYPLPLCSRRDQQLARQLIESNNLRFETNFHDLVGYFEDGRLIACGARRGRVLKMLVVAEEFRGEGVIAPIVTELMRLGREAGEEGFFVFTRACSVHSVTRLGFKPLAEFGGITWLEHGGEIRQYLVQHAALARPGRNAAVLTDADPFTLGHLRLVERAAGEADTVVVFVRADGPHWLPLSVRLELARQSVARIASAVVTDTGPYRLPVDRFPGYFLRPGDDANQIRIGLEEHLFGRHIAKPFQIRARVVGVDPLQPDGRSYHQMIQPHLARWDIRLLEVGPDDIPAGQWISPRQAREDLRDSDGHVLAQALPAPVLDYLQRQNRANLLSTHEG